MASTLPPIVLEIEASAPPAEAWAAVTIPERIAEWFTDGRQPGRAGSTRLAIR